MHFAGVGDQSAGLNVSMNRPIHRVGLVSQLLQSGLQVAVMDGSLTGRVWVTVGVVERAGKIAFRSDQQPDRWLL